MLYVCILYIVTFSPTKNLFVLTCYKWELFVSQSKVSSHSYLKKPIFLTTIVSALKWISFRVHLQFGLLLSRIHFHMYSILEIMFCFQEESETELKLSNNKLKYIFNGKILWNYNLGTQNLFVYSLFLSLATYYTKQHMIHERIRVFDKKYLGQSWVYFWQVPCHG